MKNFKKPMLIMFLAAFILVGTGCSKADAPLTEQEQAEAKGMSLEEYKDTKGAAARMNMGVEEHMNMQ